MMRSHQPPGMAGPGNLRHLLDAVISIGTGRDLPATLTRIIEAATELADARFGALGVLDDTGAALSEFITVGIDQDGLRGIGELPKGHGILGLLIADPRPLRLPDLRAHAESFGFPPGHPEMQSFLGVPIRVRNKVFGNLYLTDKRSADIFSDIDEELVTALATAAGVAVDNARLNAQARDFTLFEDRERIAMDLHDGVIQQLFAVGLSLQATAKLAADHQVARRLDSAVTVLDETIKQIRSTIFMLGRPATDRAGGVRDRLLRLADEMAPTLGLRPLVVFEGALESVMSDEVADELVTVLREGLSNVARHARATRVVVHLLADADSILLRVEDDGMGLQPAYAEGNGRGLPNLIARASRLGGSFTLRANDTEPGATLEFRVPQSTG